MLKILARNIHDTAALTATSEAMPVAYTQVSDRPLVWRSGNLQPQTISADLPEIEFIDCVAITRHNLGSLGKVRIKLFLRGDAVYDSGELATSLLIPAGTWRAGIDPWGATYNDKMPAESALTIHWLDTAIAADSYQIISTAETAEGYQEIGRIFAGLSFSPSTNFSYGVKVDWLETGEHQATEAGSLRTTGFGQLRRQIELPLNWLNDGDRQQLVNQLVKIGINSDLLVSLYPGAGEMLELEHSMVCRRQPNLSLSHTFYNNWESQLVFMEV